ncbi:MAG: hypothetical protein ACKVS9_01840 [Phycisphaerae bacterium]
MSQRVWYAGLAVFAAAACAIAMAPLLIMRVPMPRAPRIEAPPVPAPASAPTAASVEPLSEIPRDRPVSPPVASKPVVTSSRRAQPTARPILAATQSTTTAIATATTASRPATLPQPAPDPVERTKRNTRFGGNAATLGAVDVGLAWLAAHQDRDGTWDRFEFMRHCPRGDECTGPALNRTGVSLDAGLTGLCLLAFLGDGHTDASPQYGETVARAVTALLRAQDNDGNFGGEDRMAGYNTSLATFALAEYLTQTGNPDIVEPLRRAVAALTRSQQRHGGWDYLADAESGRNDTSITGWVVQALQACEAAGVDVPHEVFVRTLLHFARATQRDGRVWYTDAGTGFKIDRDTAEPAYRYGAAMIGVGIVSNMLLGVRPDAEITQRQQGLLLADPPSIGQLQGGDATQLHDYYYWYYGTVGLFQLGGPEWERWNGSLRDALLTMQDRKVLGDRRRSHSFGSYPPFGQEWGKWGKMGSRVYTTAISTLALQIYYRKTPAYLENPSRVTPQDIRAFLADARPADRRLLVRSLAWLRFEIGEPVLVDLENDEDGDIARLAAMGLAEIGSPMGAGVLRRQLADASPSERVRIQQALDRIAAIDRDVSATVRHYDAQRRLATIDLRGGHVGVELDVRRGEAIVSRLRVIQRFSGQAIAVAERVDDGNNELLAGFAATAVPP